VELKSSYQNTKETPKSNYSVPLESINRNMVSKSKKLSISNRTNKNLKNEIDESQIDPYVKNLSKLNEENFDNSNLKKEDLNKESKNKIKNPNFSSHQKLSKIITPPKSSATYKIGSEKNPHPTYPLIARKKGWEGRVVLQTDVDKQGNVKFIRILESSGFKVLDDISIETLKTWKFKPAKLGNKFVDDIVDIPVKFVLTN
ncbi:MAG: energy transducer TonB, partial [Pseudomonadota bacterium]|nr:energy transducer TonB [Pseudomonadota bacterium]